MTDVTLRELHHYRDGNGYQPAEDDDSRAQSEPSTIGMRLTDLGNAERLIARYRDRIRYCPPRRRWLVWDGRRWCWDETGEITRFAKKTVRAIYGEAEHARNRDHADEIAKHAHRSESESKIQALIKLAASEPGVPVMPNELDAHPWLVVAENCEVDLRTGATSQHRRENLLTKIAGAPFDPEARSELWERFLRDATKGDDELAAYLQRMAGCALYGSVIEKAFWFLYGLPDGMKSTFIAAIMRAFGGYAATADFTTWLVQSNTGGNRGDLVSLMGARLVCSVEVRKGARFDEAMLKRVTGGDAIKAAAKFEDEIEFLPMFCLWLAGNDAPTIRDDDEGAWSRVRRIPFVNALPKAQQDPEMRAKLAEPPVRAAILAWAVKGCGLWLREGLGSCAAVEQSTAAYRAEMDRIAGFIESECVFEPNAFLHVAQWRDAYEAWCDEQGVKPLSGKETVARLKEHGVTPAKSKGVRRYDGIRFVRDDERDTRTAGQGNPYTSSDIPLAEANREKQALLSLLSTEQQS